ncbi:cell division protein FtsQ/DivIB [Rehaibacterium terrae]|uniref:Cell division protein FtsQ n=1 Tax=Rehaibacterium terrae TaxID=1341696 RepID=A0A7W7V7G8_9GAMM|nr:cell division protein FtsQ/DivIB [Rehaibacterium terrae]MBB5014552.1 cell division protein FtsQ [Rehaibacterium terrae]
MNAGVRLTAWIVALLMLALPIVAVLNGWIASERWPMRRLQVTGEFRQVDAEQVRDTVVPHLGSGFFAVRLDEVRAAVAALPWVERVEVRKRWPDVLEVALVEHRAYARWGEDRLLSDRGVLFAASGRGLERLPVFDGPDGRVREVVALFNQARTLFAGTGLAVHGVRVSARGSWSLSLSDGTEIVLGRTDTEARLARFVRLLPQLLAAEQRRLVRADLRYTNGFALVWGEAGARDPGPGAPGSAGKASHLHQGVACCSGATPWMPARAGAAGLAVAPAPGFSGSRRPISDFRFPISGSDT